VVPLSPDVFFGGKGGTFFRIYIVFLPLLPFFFFSLIKKGSGPFFPPWPFFLSSSTWLPPHFLATQKLFPPFPPEVPGLSFFSFSSLSPISPFRTNVDGLLPSFARPGQGKDPYLPHFSSFLFPGWTRFKDDDFPFELMSPSLLEDKTGPLLLSTPARDSRFPLHPSWKGRPRFLLFFVHLSPPSRAVLSPFWPTFFDVSSTVRAECYPFFFTTVQGRGWFFRAFPPQPPFW